MGLAICRQVVERHGGEITAKSSPGHGPKLIVTLPTRQHKTAVKQAPSSEAEEVTLPVLASSPCRRLSGFSLLRSVADL
jgi:hypothetical protein